MLDRICAAAIQHFGVMHQVDVATEELAELIQALSKFKRDRPDYGNIAEEIADVEICLVQLRMIFEGITELIEINKEYKLERLKKEIQAHK